MAAGRHGWGGTSGGMQRPQYSARRGPRQSAAHGAESGSDQESFISSTFASYSRCSPAALTVILHDVGLPAVVSSAQAPLLACEPSEPLISLVPPRLSDRIVCHHLLHPTLLDTHITTTTTRRSATTLSTTPTTTTTSTTQTPPPPAPLPASPTARPMHRSP